MANETFLVSLLYPHETLLPIPCHFFPILLHSLQEFQH